jgi:tRNA threonylcarbamoyladenosine biosynthesis protein TsaB
VKPFDGLLLAMETAGREGSAALAAPLGGDPGQLEVLARISLLAEEEHASLLIPRIQELMEEMAAEPSDLSGIVVGAGPGSFTGVRVAAATAKGLARALDLPLWAFSSLAAAAVEGGSPGGDTVRGPRVETGDRPDPQPSSDFDAIRPRCVLFDARGDRVYAAAYRLSGRRLDTVLEPRAATVGEMLDGLLPPGVLLMGEGALRHRAILEEAGHPVLGPPFGHPTADGLIRLLSLDPEISPLDDPGRWEPEYLRASGAERMWKTRKGIGG